MLGMFKFRFRFRCATVLALGVLSLGMTFASAIPAHALEESELPDKAKLSANRMRFDSKSGDFIADGNVLIEAGGLTVASPRSTGNTERREVLFEDGITASGEWLGDKVDLKAGALELSFANAPTCRLRNGVRGGFGSMRLDADKLTLIGAGGIAPGAGGSNDRKTKFWLVKARKLEDKSQGITFGANSIEGVMRDGELHTMTAKDSVWIAGRPKNTGDPVSLKGAHALYSLDRGSVVVSGGVTAVQGGRTLKSESIVYFPDQNRVEALGGAKKDNKTGEVQTGRAEITIDLKRERKK